MAVPKFDPKELELSPNAFFSRPMDRFSFPLNQREAADKALREKDPWWMWIQAVDTTPFMPGLIPDDTARAFVFEAEADKYPEKGGLDMFGIDWEFIPTVGGSMVRPGVPFMEDIEEWEEKVVWPDIDSWDWEGASKANRGTWLKDTNFNQMWFFTGWFERLISMLEFENALMALFDEDSQEYVHSFFTKLTDLYIEIFKRVKKYFPEVNAVFVHDDWGSQKETFFSPDLVEEMIVPYMKRFTDWCHENDIYCELHSCGNNYKQVPNMIKAGWDLWCPQLMCDSYKIYDDFGDQIMICTFPQNIPEEVMAQPSDAEKGAAFAALPEEQQIAIAKEFAHRVNKPGKPSVYAFYAWHWMTPAFQAALYEETRKIYSGEIEA